MSRVTRGRASKVDLLPEALKDELHKLLRDKSNTQLEVLDAVNELIEAHGLDESLKLSRSGLNRYAAQMETVGSKIAEAREVSKQWIAKLGNDANEGDVSKILIEMVRTLAFDSVVKMGESEEPIPPKLIKELAQGVERLERAASEGQKREMELRKQFAQDAANEIERIGKAEGLTDDTVQLFRSKILGIV